MTNVGFPYTFRPPTKHEEKLTGGTLRFGLGRTQAQGKPRNGETWALERRRGRKKRRALDFIILFGHPRNAKKS